MLRWALEDEGWEVQAAADGMQALVWLASHRPDLLLLDFHLPVVDGSAVARELRASYGDTVPIVAITADPSASERARRLGAIATFNKPFDVDQLTATVQLALARV
jgi:DNA-binding response OmpR family regulator